MKLSFLAVLVILAGCSKPAPKLPASATVTTEAPKPPICTDAATTKPDVGNFLIWNGACWGAGGWELWNVSTKKEWFAMVNKSKADGQQDSQTSAQKLSVPTAPTIPPDAMYALGQQSGQLTSISGRLGKIEDKLDGCSQDITRINTIGGLVLLFVTIFWGPIAVERWKTVFSKTPTPPAGH